MSTLSVVDPPIDGLVCLHARAGLTCVHYRQITINCCICAPEKWKVASLKMIFG